MDEKQLNRLRVIERTEETLEETVKVRYTLYTNPIYKSMLKFHHEPIGKKFAVSDLF